MAAPAEAEIPIEQRGDEEVKYAEARKQARLLDGSEWDLPYTTRLSVSFWD